MNCMEANCWLFESIFWLNCFADGLSRLLAAIIYCGMPELFKLGGFAFESVRVAF